MIWRKGSTRYSQDLSLECARRGVLELWESRALDSRLLETKMESTIVSLVTLLSIVSLLLVRQKTSHVDVSSKFVVIALVDG